MKRINFEIKLTPSTVTSDNILNETKNVMNLMGKHKKISLWYGGGGKLKSIDKARLY